MKLTLSTLSPITKHSIDNTAVCVLRTIHTTDALLLGVCDARASVESTVIPHLLLKVGLVTWGVPIAPLVVLLLYDQKVHFCGQRTAFDNKSFGFVIFLLFKPDGRTSKVQTNRLSGRVITSKSFRCETRSQSTVPRRATVRLRRHNTSAQKRMYLCSQPPL